MPDVSGLWQTVGRTWTALNPEANPGPASAFQVPKRWRRQETRHRVPNAISANSLLST